MSGTYHSVAIDMASIMYLGVASLGATSTGSPANFILLVEGTAHSLSGSIFMKHYKITIAIVEDSHVTTIKVSCMQ